MKLKLAEEGKVKKKCWGRGCPLSWAPCYKTWLKFEGKGFRCSRKEKKKLFGSWVTPLVGRHVVNEPKVGCYIVNELEVS